MSLSKMLSGTNAFEISDIERMSIGARFPGYGPKGLWQQPQVGLPRSFNSFSQSTPGNVGFLRQSILNS
jgi:hypothetical protein